MDDLLARYGGLVYSLARRFCLSPAEVEDAVQEVFIALWQSASRFDPELGAEDTFVSTVARRRLIDRRRKSRRRARHTSEADVSQNAAPAETPRTEISDDAARAAEVFATLRPEQQQCLRLSVYQGLSHEEIAAATGMPLGTVKTHVRRGLIALRDALEKNPKPADVSKTPPGEDDG